MSKLSAAVEDLLYPSPPGSLPASENKPTIVGIYGIPGSGKSFLLAQLQESLDHEYFAFYEGSEVIASFVEGGLDHFHNLSSTEKQLCRALAIAKIQKECLESGEVGVVTGHFMFWDENHDVGHCVLQKSDWNTYTHILYLDATFDTIAARRKAAEQRTRPFASCKHLEIWQQEEKSQLRRLCLQHGILFTLISENRQKSSLDTIKALLQDFRVHSEEYNQSKIEEIFDLFLFSGDGFDKFLIFDGDKTLGAEDTGSIFWQKIGRSRWPGEKEESPLKTLFSSGLGYSYKAFKQAMLLYKEVADDLEFQTLCGEVAKEITVHPDLVSLLQRVAKEKNIAVVVISCGLGHVWGQVLQSVGVTSNLIVLGGECLDDGFVVTPKLKASLVKRAQSHGAYIYAFGDSPLDIGMLAQADKAVVVVGAKEGRSQSMDAALRTAISSGLRAHQVLLPPDSPARLDPNILPITNINTIKDLILNPRPRMKVFHATRTDAARLLMTPMRDADVKGPALREAHRRAGWYISVHCLTTLLGLSHASLRHVSGNMSSGYYLKDEESTLIVALMRGGEPMAIGVSDAFARAPFMHVKEPGDIKGNHIKKISTVILVDSVINTGKSVLEFVKHLRNLCFGLKIVVVAGVIQKGFLNRKEGSQGGVGELEDQGVLGLVALRVSENKFTGKGTTDTGNRLFNTTYL